MKTKSIYDKLNPPVREAFKVLRTNIQFSSNEKKLKSITIVSCNPKEGKTSVAINLAISTARAGLKVLLVDADLRKPTVVKRLGEEDISGFSSFLCGDLSLADAICNTNINNLQYMSCGPKPPNPSELISSDQFKSFIKTAEELFDMVLIDTSSLASVIDAAIIASQTDGTLLVIESRAVPARKAKRLKEQLEKSNANIIGAVLNKVSKRDYKLYNSHYNNMIYFSDTVQTPKQAKKPKTPISNPEVNVHD